MSVKARQDKTIDIVRVAMSTKLHKRVKQAALDEDVNVSELVRCVLDYYTSLPRNQRNLVKHGCKDNIAQTGEVVPIETEPENL